MLRPQGYLQIVSDGPVLERDTVTCGHCQRIVLIKPRSAATVYLVPQLHGPDLEVPGAGCRICMRPVCLACEALGVCTPWERRLEMIEGRGLFLRSAGLG